VAPLLFYAVFSANTTNSEALILSMKSVYFHRIWRY
jgi:hypothetical protein